MHIYVARLAQKCFQIGDVSFFQPLQLRCLRHGSTEAYLCSPLSSIPLSTAVYVTICGMCIMASVQD